MGGDQMVGWSPLFICRRRDAEIKTLRFSGENAAEVRSNG